MEPARQRELFQEFLKRAVVEHSFGGGNMTILAGPGPSFLAGKGPFGHATAADVQRFERLLGVVPKNGFFNLNAEQCDLALNEIIKDSAIRPGIGLLQSVGISKWLIDGVPVGTLSRMSLYYGMKPCVSTFLQFETAEQFDFVKKILADLKFCKLNEKHLKPIKRGKKNDDAEASH